MSESTYKYLSRIERPQDIKKLSLDELLVLAEEIRQEITRVVFETGGHLGSNLGVVELTLALHYIFDAHRDVFVWDVSNQTYVHKLLTGRRERFHTLRQYKGVSGFGNREESPYDPFTWGHAGTSISAALGIVCGDEQAGYQRKVVAITGDGALTEGISYEALNNAGHFKKDLLIILNDNGMSISPTVGAFSKYLNDLRTAPLYDEFKKDVKSILEKLPLVGMPLEQVLLHLREGIKATLGMNFFSVLGLKYYGPIDGHDLKQLLHTLENLKHQREPLLLHVITKKGKGHPDADKDFQALHGISPKGKESKVEKGFAPPSKTSYTKSFAKSLIKLAQKEPRLVAITAAMPEGTGLIEFEKVYPKRYWDVGLCEQHAVALAAGLAHAGVRPVVAIYSTFLQRAYDQVFQEVCVQNLPVILALDRGGIAGADGPTHHGVLDIAYLRTLPNMILMAPKDGVELEKMLGFALTLKQPCAIRYPRANVPGFNSFSFKEQPLTLGKGEVLLEGRDGVLFAYGAMVETALKVAQTLLQEEIHIGVVNARFAKPIDTELIAALLQRAPWLLTLEDHALMGGFGSAVLEAASDVSADIRKIHRLGIPNRFIEHGERHTLLEAIGLDEKGVANAVRSLIYTGKLPSDAQTTEPLRASH